MAEIDEVLEFLIEIWISRSHFQPYESSVNSTQLYSIIDRSLK